MNGFILLDIGPIVPPPESLFSLLTIFLGLGLLLVFVRNDQQRHA